MSENWLKEYGFNALQLPRRDLRPLDVLRMSGDGIPPTKAGTVDMLLSADVPLPEIVAGEPTGGISEKRTRKLEGHLGLSVLSSLLGALTGGRLGASTRLGKAKTMEVTYEDVVLDSVAELALQRWIEEARINAPRSARADLDGSRFAVVTAALRSANLTVAVDQHADGGVSLDVPEISGIVSADASLAITRADGSQITFQGPEPITFGTQTFVLLYEGNLTMGLQQVRGVEQDFSQDAWTVPGELPRSRTTSSELTMADDADVLDRLSGVDVHVLANVIGQPTTEQRQRLIEFLGQDRYARLRDLALRRGVRARPERGLGNVVVIPGILGSELAQLNTAGERRTIWPRASELAAGGMMRLRLGRDGRAGPEDAGAIYARGIVTRHYGELLLTLAARWDVRAFWYDWRKDIGIAASELETRLREWFPDGAPVHLIGHGMGGLVARRFTLAYKERWASMRGVDLLRGGRLILLGTPNLGSPTAAQVLAGVDPIVYKLSALDVAHSHEELREVLASFPSLHQLLPAPKLAPSIYHATAWGDLNISQSSLDLAREHHENRLFPGGDDRTIVIAGVGQPTVTGLKKGNMRSSSRYQVSRDGDGHVPAASARLDGSAATYFVTAGHADLLTEREVLRALSELLETGTTNWLATEPPVVEGEADAAKSYDTAREREVLAVRDLVSRQARSGESRGSRHLGRGQERDVEDLLVRGVIAGTSLAADEAAASLPVEQMPKRQVIVTVVHGAIEDVHALAKDVDATAVGHYVDVPPQAAEAAIDAAISNYDRADAVPETERVINAMTNRGVLAGRLGEMFLLPDPRVGGDGLIALAGMGEPGRFGVPELTVLARELCWALGRLGKHSLATVLIGSGNGNLTIDEAVDGWLRGVRASVQTSPERDGQGLRKITFVEEDPRKIAHVHTALGARCEDTEGVEYRPPSPEAEQRIRELAYARDKEELDRLWKRAQDAGNGVPQRSDIDAVPTRVSLSLEGNAYRYGAISADASVPERVVPLDPELVRDASAELTTERQLVRQMQRGEFLGRLLLPRDLAAHLDGNAPIVMLLDSNTARINWEMVATGSAAPPAVTEDAFAAEEEAALDRFLGTSRGFTRQLRSRLAPPPDPPPPPRQVLKVLVIADPAEDLPLLGAQEEGQAVADLFTSFNRVWADKPQHRVAVTALFGHEATRTNVLRHLISERYDVLHYAGHCVFDAAHPARSGWIFTGGKRLSVNELSRVDRVPKFVFSNACESGVTADDASAATSDLAPGFAQAFFARGVSNFICTAWPVNDRAALAFARVLYRLLLALPEDGEERPARAATLHQAMRLARRKIATTPSGRLTWGAYQHYGNPHFRLFDWLQEDEPSRNGGLAEAPQVDALSRE